MQTHFIELTNDKKNWGKFLLIRFDNEYEYKSQITNNSLLREVGWNPRNIIIFDLQTGEGARFTPPGCAKADLEKHQIWVCPMFEPFLNWLYEQNVTKLTELPSMLNIPSAEFAISGYRRPGPKKDGEVARH